MRNPSFNPHSVRTRAGADLKDEVLLKLADYELMNPRITEMRLDAQGVVNDGKKAVLAPLYVLRRGNHPDLLAAAKSGLPAHKQMQTYLHNQMKHKRVFAIKHDIYFTGKR